jgi:protein-S-isoprenylcysteine O-methyltransferase Ste14
MNHLPLRVSNLAASATVVAFAVFVYSASPYNQGAIGASFHLNHMVFTGGEFLVWAACAYLLLLAAYYLGERNPGASKSLLCLSLCFAYLKSPAERVKSGLSRKERTAVLTTLLKVFFAPFMFMALMTHVFGMMINAWAIYSGIGVNSGWLQLFNQHGFWFAMKLILFVDVLFFTVGYLVEIPRLDNEIRSVDPTLMGWAAALLCYPPFNQLTGAVLGSSVTDFPKFDDPMTHVALNVLLLLLMAVYASASVALGLKASNLTHRGIVARGPYAWVRHPAYTAKNLAWWIGAIPFVSAAFSQSAWSGISAVASVVGWSMLYVLRALTEEEHLRSVDSEYAVYTEKVRFRFIPRVY